MAPVKQTIWVGWDPREAAAFAVARHSARRLLTAPIPVFGLVLDNLIGAGLYSRPMEWRDGYAGNRIMWDLISQAPMSTQHACARFLVPHLAGSGWALFIDGDVLLRGNLARLFDELDPDMAVCCVKHTHVAEYEQKMDGQVQTRYHRKNWSSVMAFNCDHPSNKKLTVEAVNVVPGRRLHRFFWLKDHEIGELDQSWNFLVGHTDPAVDPKLVHFTDGCPDMPGYEDVPFAEEWRAERARWAS